MSQAAVTSTRPYLVRAIYEWCTDNGFTPYVAVLVDETVQVPREYVKDGEIVLNISFDATQALKLDNDFIEFKARFGGVAREILVPMNRVAAIYARENGQGMAFPQPDAGAGSGTATASRAGSSDTAKSQPPSPVSIVPVASLPQEAMTSPSTDTDPPRPPAGSRPSLKRVK